MLLDRAPTSTSATTTITASPGGWAAEAANTPGDRKLHLPAAAKPSTSLTPAPSTVGLDRVHAILGKDPAALDLTQGRSPSVEGQGEHGTAFHGGCRLGTNADILHALVSSTSARRHQRCKTVVGLTPPQPSLLERKNEIAITLLRQRGSGYFAPLLNSSQPVTRRLVTFWRVYPSMTITTRGVSYSLPKTEAVEQLRPSLRRTRLLVNARDSGCVAQAIHLPRR